MTRRVCSRGMGTAVTPLRQSREGRRATARLAGTLCLLAVACATLAAQRVDTNPNLVRKESLTPAQQKIDSRLFQEIVRRRSRNTQPAAPAPQGIRIDARGRAYVDVRAEVTPALRKKVEAAGGTIVSTSVEYRSIVAWLPLLKLEHLAQDPAVHAISPTPEPMREIK